MRVDGVIIVISQDTLERLAGNCMESHNQVNSEKGLLFSKNSRLNTLELRLYTNTDWVGSITDRRSTTSVRNLAGKITIQEPTFDRIIVVYRRACTAAKPERGIYVKHFKNIPMADMEIVLVSSCLLSLLPPLTHSPSQPEKKNPGLTPMDWVKFIASAVVGLVAVVGSLDMPKADLWVIIAILSTLIGYCAKTYFTDYMAKQLLMLDLSWLGLGPDCMFSNISGKHGCISELNHTIMYDKQLDSGKGTLLHLCDDVIQQEVKEVIISFFILMEQGKATRQDLDSRCEELIKEEFGEDCNFDVDDAVQKLEKLGIVARDTIGRYYCVGLKHANDIIGTTTEELVLKAKQGSLTS
ncbi:hypothetical protein CK203_015010 [Vitis vinifera]|uniref:Uncharacterized protein n=1 Tax=Vitis vinifera TaxID=29760 RepID=A0A438JDF3_VITVI|nr:hypothetical protein CK203_015010 [Vitis vinifera]